MGEYRPTQYDSSTEGSILPRGAETSSVHRNSKKPLLEAPSLGNMNGCQALSWSLIHIGISTPAFSKSLALYC